MGILKSVQLQGFQKSLSRWKRLSRQLFLFDWRAKWCVCETQPTFASFMLYCLFLSFLLQNMTNKAVIVQKMGSDILSSRSLHCYLT